MTHRSFLTDLFHAAVARAQPQTCVPAFLPEAPKGKTIVLGAGKASAAMAQAFERHWPHPLTGTVLTRYGFSAPCERITIIEGGHPVPDQAGAEATRLMLQHLHGLSTDDLVVVLLSGGASALLTLPAHGLDLNDKIEVNKALLDSGAPIHVMNCIRKHLSGVKGGRLALAAQPAHVVTLSISDVPGDDPAVIGSGPTVPDPSTLQDARQYLEDYKIDLPKAARLCLDRDESETPKPGALLFDNCETRLIATPAEALQAAQQIAERAGYRVVLLGDALEGEACDVARHHAEMARDAEPGTLLLSGGELTVTHPGTGKGGPNTEYALALALALDHAPGIHAMACDTDGIDGSEDNAGAVIDPSTLSRAETAGLDAQAHLSHHNSFAFFEPLGDLVRTGPTRTNVNDFRAILIV